VERDDQPLTGTLGLLPFPTRSATGGQVTDGAHSVPPASAAPAPPEAQDPEPGECGAEQGERGGLRRGDGGSGYIGLQI